jgi:transposase
MRGSDAVHEQLFSFSRLEDLIPANHPLRVIRTWVNAALVDMNDMLDQMYAAGHKGGRPSIAPEKLVRAMLLQVLYSVRSERQLMEQVRYNMLFRWFIGLAMDDRVWDPSVFSKNRERFIEHEPIVELFNHTLDTARRRGWLSEEHFSVDGTLIQAWAGHKSFRRKDGSDDDAPGGDFRGTTRSNETHASTTDPDARLSRKGGMGAELRYMGHALIENRNALVVNAQVSTVDGHAEREAAKSMLADAVQSAPEGTTLTVGADKGYDVAEFVSACQELGVVPHVARNTAHQGGSAVPEAIAATESYAISQQKRKRIEIVFGWSKLIGPLRQVMLRGFERVDQLHMLTMTAFNLTRMRTLDRFAAQVRPAAG